MVLYWSRSDARCLLRSMLMMALEQKPVLRVRNATSCLLLHKSSVLFSRVLHTMICHFRVHAFARSVTEVRSLEEQGSSSSRQQEVGHCLRLATVAVDRLCVVDVAPPPHRCLCTAKPSAQAVQRTPTEPRLVRPCW